MQENESTYHQDPMYCFPDYPVIQKDTVVSVSQAFTPQIEKISEKPKLQDSIFIIFLFCFIIISRILSSKARMFLSLPNELFRLKKRKSIFTEPVGNELYVKLLLFFQTVVILSMFTYSAFTNHPEASENFTLSDFYESTGKICFLFILFFIYKWGSYNVVGTIFFSKETLAQWINNFTSLMCILGIVIFVPVLLMFYVEWMYSFCYFFILSCFLIVIAIIIYRTHVLFFHNIHRLHYLFLYLCAQEMAPLLILYKGLVYLT